MNIVLSDVEARVLGSLIEKELTTPEYYPLSLNALVNACNQKSNRDPVMHVDERAVSQALRVLESQGLAGPADNYESRVAKFEHRLQEAFNFTRHEVAIICELLLRGPQTPGELRGRTERLHRFDEISDVVAALQKLIEREPSLAVMMQRQPGTKESRYAHLLSGPVESIAVAQVQSGPESSAENLAQEERIVQLEASVAALREEVSALRQKIDSLFG